MAASPIGVSRLDVKLGLRRLVKHPGLTFAAVFALAVGIPVGMAPMHLADALEAPLPEDPGDRIRVIRYWNTESQRAAPASSFELERWREDLTTFEILAAVRPDVYNLPSDDGSVVPVSGAEVTASAFDLLGTAPLMGRRFDADDDRMGGPDVVLLGYDLWRGRFAGDADVVGKTLVVGQISRTVVGVMPRGFRFPAREQLWVPLRDEMAVEPGVGEPLQVFGRLAPGVDAERAQAEVATFAPRMAARYPERFEHVQSEVVAFGAAAMGLPRGGAGAIPGFFVLQALCLVLLLVACSNVAMLIFAKTATRFRELAIRAALGASRARVATQMFVESLVLTVSAALLGVAGYQLLLGRLLTAMEQSDRILPFPYWFNLGVSGRTVAWSLVFAVGSAALVGALPALMVTGKRIQRSIQEAQAARTGLRFGSLTSVLIVTDVAVAVAAVGLAIGFSDRVTAALGDESYVGIPAAEYLAVQLDFPAGESAPATRLELVERLRAEPRVRGVAVADALPRMDHEALRVEVEGEAAAGSLGFLEGLNRFVAVARVDPGYFDALDRPVLRGRSFDQADLTQGDARVAIVNTSFVDRVLGGRNPIGRRIRFPTNADDDTAPWHEIVGVVERLGMDITLPEYDQGVYLPAAPGELRPLLLALHLRGDPVTFEARVRQIVDEVDPRAVVSYAVSLDSMFTGEWYFFMGTTAAVGVLVFILVAMAASGIYAIMSFSVSERTRDIGLRTALGATRSSIGYFVAKRSLIQMGVGALVGVPLAAWLFQLTYAGESTAGVSLGVAFSGGVGIVALIGLVACLAPTVRALRIQATEALRWEG